MQTMTFRSSKIIYYGPFNCAQCGVDICKMGEAFGGNSFTYPEGPIYPNSEWHPHVCDQRLVRKLDGEGAKRWVLSKESGAQCYRDGMGFAIRAVDVPLSCYSTDEQGAWIDAFENLFKARGPNEIGPPSLRSNPGDGQSVPLSSPISGQVGTAWVMDGVTLGQNERDRR